MIKPLHRRKRDRKLGDPAVAAATPPVPPSGPAGGDLGANYPDPTVVSLAHVAAGGDLSGTMDAPTVVNLSHALIGPALYPAGSAASLTNVPPPPTLSSGIGQLDGNGTLNLEFLTTANQGVGAWYETVGAGQIYTDGAPLRIRSTAGGADTGLSVVWIAF